MIFLNLLPIRQQSFLSSDSSAIETRVTVKRPSKLGREKIIHLNGISLGDKVTYKDDTYYVSYISSHHKIGLAKNYILESEFYCGIKEVMGTVRKTNLPNLLENQSTLELL